MSKSVCVFGKITLLFGKIQIHDNSYLERIFYVLQRNKFDRSSQETTLICVADIYTLLKDSFKDILQELMEAELDATLGYERKTIWRSEQTIKRMVILQKLKESIR